MSVCIPRIMEGMGEGGQRREKLKCNVRDGERWKSNGRVEDGRDERMQMGVIEVVEVEEKREVGNAKDGKTKS